MHQVFTSWSGGKDSCFASYLAASSGLNVRYLLNMVTEDGKRSWTHGQSAELLKAQSQAIGIPLVQRRTTMKNYEAELKDTLLALKQKGVGGGVFGDIDLDEHRQWVERVCREVDITPYLPLWGEAQEKILKDFIKAGFEAIIVVVKAELFDEEWLGRKVDLELLSQLKPKLGAQLCGEAGEYHTFVIDGPLFHRRIEILETNTVFKEGYWFLEIVKSKLRAK